MEGRKHNLLAINMLRSSIARSKVDDATFNTILTLAYAEVSIQSLAF